MEVVSALFGLKTGTNISSTLQELSTKSLRDIPAGAPQAADYSLVPRVDVHREDA